MTTCRLSLMSLAQVSSGCCSSSVLAGGQCPGDVSGQDIPILINSVAQYPMHM